MGSVRMPRWYPWFTQHSQSIDSRALILLQDLPAVNILAAMGIISTTEIYQMLCTWMLREAWLGISVHNTASMKYCLIPFVTHFECDMSLTSSFSCRAMPMLGHNLPMNAGVVLPMDPMDLVLCAIWNALEIALRSAEERTLMISWPLGCVSHPWMITEWCYLCKMLTADHNVRGMYM